MNAIMDTMAVHQSMSRQALNSDAIRAALLATMLAQGGLWEAFRQRPGAVGHA
jgi:type I restriction enzyme R subunit